MENTLPPADSGLVALPPSMLDYRRDADDIRNALAEADVEEFVTLGVAFYPRDAVLLRCKAGVASSEPAAAADAGRRLGTHAAGWHAPKNANRFQRGQSAAMSADPDSDELPKGWSGSMQIPSGA